MNIYEKLIAMQEELKAPKNLYNSFGKYAYRNAESILEAAKPLEKKYGAALIVYDKIEDKAHGTYITAHARLTDAEKPDDYIEVTASAREAEQKKGMDTMQITGCASSYARKYALNGLFCIDDTKDSDALPPEENAPKKCGRCGKTITDKCVKSGTYSAEQIAQNAIRMHGMPLCWDCYLQANKESIDHAGTAD